MSFKRFATFNAIILAILLISSFSAQAQEPSAAQATVHAAGIVQVSAGIPVPGASVRLVHTATGQAWVSWTDENGKFDIPGLPPGKYRVEVDQLGFQTATVETEFNPQPAAPATGSAAQPAPFVVRMRVAALAAPVAQAPAQPPTGAPPTPAAGTPPANGEPAKPSASGTAPNSGTPATATADKNAPAQPPAGAKPGQPPAGNRPGANGQPPTGFRQTNVGGQQSGLTPTEVTPPNTGDFGALGDAASSDAILAQGTVGRGATAGADMFMVMAGMAGMGGLAGFGPGMEGMGGMPGQGGPPPGMGGATGQGGPGAPGGGLPGGMGNIMIFNGGPGGAGGGQPANRGGQQGGRGGQGGQQGGNQGGQGQGGRQQNAQQGPQRQQFGEGAGGLYGLQRILRQQANRVRFSVFERYGNSIFNARPYSLTQTNPPKISSYNSAFGATLGGPLIIPKVYNGRDKTFFFISYTGGRSRNPVDSFATVPTDPERGGDFTDRGLLLYDPASSSSGPRTLFGSVIPTGRISSVALGLLPFIPHANLPGLVQNFHFQTRIPTATDSFNVRLIHTISQKFNAQVIYSISQSRSHSFASFPTLEGNSDTRGQSLTLGLTQTYSRRFINDTRVIWSRNRSNSLNNFAFNNDIAGNLGVTGISADPINFGVPQVSWTNFTGLNDPVPALRRNQSMRTLDNISWILPKHTFRFGGELRRIQTNTISDPTPRGLFSFTGLASAGLDPFGKPITGTGNDLADFLLGLPQSTSIRFGSSSTYFRSWGIVAYAQDDWKVHPRFTLSYGLRWEALTPPSELKNHIADLVVDPTFTQVATVTPGQTNPFDGTVLPSSLVHGNYKSFMPRFGIAWRPKIKGLDQKHSTVIRAGYSMFYNLSIYNQLATSLANQPPWAQAQTQQTSATQILTFQNGFPAVPLTTAKNTIAVDPFYRPGYAEIWNFGIEQQITTQWSLNLTYTGTKGNHLDLQRAPNRLAPGLVQSPTIVNALGFTYDTSAASSIYNALQVHLQRRFNRGLLIQGTYTFAKSIDNASSIGGGAPVVVQDDLNPQLDRGLSAFDIRHQLRVNYMYEFPFGERKRWARKGWQEHVFGTWSVNGNTSWQTGSPYTARVQGFVADNSGAGNSFSERADQVGDPNTGLGLPLNFFNTAAFGQPPLGRFGDAARGTITGPGAVTVNFGLSKGMRFGKDGQRRADFRWEVNNLLNHPNFGGLSTVINSSTYGRVLGVQGMRTMGFQLRVNF